MNTDIFIGISFIVAFILAQIMIPRITAIAIRFSLFAKPSKRKKHKGNIPQLGGFSFLPSIFFSVLFSMSLCFILVPGAEANIERIAQYSMEKYIMRTRSQELSVQSSIGEYGLLFCGAILLFITGMKDDLIGVRYRSKFKIQIIAAIIFLLSGLYFNNLYGLFGINFWPLWLGVPLSVFFIVFITNAINLIDGIDGLASSICFIGFTVLGILFMMHGSWIYSMIAFACTGVLIVFIYYNVFGSVSKGEKIFMGDTGSLTLGYLLACLLIRYACVKPEASIQPASFIILTLSTIIIPSFDVVSVVLTRIKQRKHLFVADRNHVHHKLIDSGLSPWFTLLFLLLLTVGFCAFNYALSKIHTRTTWIFLINIIIWTCFNMVLSYLRDRKKKSVF